MFKHLDTTETQIFWKLISQSGWHDTFAVHAAGSHLQGCGSESALALCCGDGMFLLSSLGYLWFIPAVQKPEMVSLSFPYSDSLFLTLFSLEQPSRSLLLCPGFVVMDGFHDNEGCSRSTYSSYEETICFGVPRVAFFPACLLET